MGVILALLIANGLRTATHGVPLWVVLSAHTAIALGTLFGGWRIVHTMGSKITKLQPAQRHDARSAAAAITLMANTLRRDPGLHDAHDHRRHRGRRDRPSACRPCDGAWRGRVVWAWVLTIPGAFMISYLVFLPFKGIGVG